MAKTDNVLLRYAEEYLSKGGDGKCHVPDTHLLFPYLPIESLEHMELMLRAQGGLQWGMIKPFNELLKSGLPIPPIIRKLFSDMVEGTCPYGFLLEAKIDPKYHNQKNRTPIKLYARICRDLSIRAQYFWEMNHTGKNRHDAAKVVFELAKKYGLAENTIKDILKASSEKRDKQLLEEGIWPKGYSPYSKTLAKQIET